MTAATHQPKDHRKLVALLLCTIPLMFGFAIFVMPPLYDALCDLTGLNGKVRQATLNPATADTTTTTEASSLAAEPVKVQLITHNHPKMPWLFTSQERSFEAIPGKRYELKFDVHNPTDRTMVAQAIPSITPAANAQYVKKMECFCFNRQTLQAGDSKVMPMVFYLDENTPKNVHTITISYTLFDVTDRDSTGEA